jgi:hypothetical protein
LLFQQLQHLQRIQRIEGETTNIRFPISKIPIIYGNEKLKIDLAAAATNVRISPIRFRRYSAHELAKMAKTRVPLTKLTNFAPNEK